MGYFGSDKEISFDHDLFPSRGLSEEDFENALWFMELAG